MITQRAQHTLNHADIPRDGVRRESAPQVVGVRRHGQLGQEIHLLVGQVLRVSTPLVDEQLAVHEVIGVDVSQLADVEKRDLGVVDPDVARRVIHLEARLLKLRLVGLVVRIATRSDIQIRRQRFDCETNLKSRLAEDVVLKGAEQLGRKRLLSVQLANQPSVVNEHIHLSLVAGGGCVHLKETRPLNRLHDVRQRPSHAVLLSAEELDMLRPLAQPDNQFTRLHQFGVQTGRKELGHTLTRRRKPKVQSIEALLHASLVHLEMLAQLVDVPSPVGNKLLLGIAGDPLLLAHLEAQGRVGALDVHIVVVRHRQSTANLPGHRLQPNTPQNTESSHVRLRRLHVLPQLVHGVQVAPAHQLPLQCPQLGVVFGGQVVRLCQHGEGVDVNDFFLRDRHICRPSREKCLRVCGHVLITILDNNSV